MSPIEIFLKQTQEQLYQMIDNMYHDKTIGYKNEFILVRGEAPIMLVAHLDTVHKEPVKEIYTINDGNILMSPQGIGGDDRCGVYALVAAYEKSKIKPWLLFTCDEEIGGKGAQKFCLLYDKGKLPKELDKLKCLVEIDRRGNKDAVYYDCDNAEFEEYIMNKGFVTKIGLFSDISYIAPVLGVAAVNLSSGYYNAHTKHEYIIRSEINSIINKVVEIVNDVTKTDFPKYKYIKRKQLDIRYNFYDEWDNMLDDMIPIDLPVKYRRMYNELLNIYDEYELEFYRKNHGDEIIYKLYKREIK